jgi:hypothetical protein
MGPGAAFLLVPHAVKPLLLEGLTDKVNLTFSEPEKRMVK